MNEVDTSDLEKKAQQWKLEGKHADSLKLRLELETLYEATGGVDDRARNLNYIAFLAIQVDNLGEAERAARKCVEVCRSTAIEREKIATYLMLLSHVLAENKKFREAVIYGKEAVEIFTQIFGENNDFVWFRKMELSRMHDEDTRPYFARQ